MAYSTTYSSRVRHGSTAKNGFQIRIVHQKIHNMKEKKALFYMTLKENIT